MIHYRSFRNSDPPNVLRLWHEAELGRGAALGFNCDALDLLVFSEPYFKSDGLIFAIDDETHQPVGYVHAGFGPNGTGTELDFTQGVICVVMVLPAYRRKGIGSELVKRAEAYLQSKGTTQIQAGESGQRSPFYLGLYGGSDAVGFLESDAAAKPFFTKLGYTVSQRHLLFRREISQKNDPFDPRLVPIRRRVQLGMMDQPEAANWWWMTRTGRFDSISFILAQQTAPELLARATVWGMDFQSASWRHRTVGLQDLFVPVPERRKAYAKTLVLEVMRQMREQLITHLDLSAPENDVPAVNLCNKLGFTPLDAGETFTRTP